MKAALLFVAVSVLVSVVWCDSFIEAEDGSLKQAPEKNVKRYHCQQRCYYSNGCASGYHCDYYRCCRQNSQKRCSHHSHCPAGWYCHSGVCRKGPRRCSSHYHCQPDVCVSGVCQKRCYHHNQCKQGYACYSGVCKAVPNYCTSDSSCQASQCCSKYHQNQQGGLCRDLKKPGAYCPLKPDGYHCGCTENYACIRYHGNRYWGTCQPWCSSDSSCDKSQCCSGGQCKARKKANDWCPYKGPDKYHCGCMDGYDCKRYHNHHYWGQCEVKPTLPPTEEPGSGGGVIDA